MYAPNLKTHIMIVHLKIGAEAFPLFPVTEHIVHEYGTSDTQAKDTFA
jgi:hypothetical protein